MAVKVEFTPDAEADLEAIGDYISQENPTAAVRLLERLRDRCLALDVLPERGRRYDDRFQVLIEGTYLIFYRLEKDGLDTTVVISIIVHGAREYGPLLDGR